MARYMKEVRLDLPPEQVEYLIKTFLTDCNLERDEGRDCYFAYLASIKSDFIFRYSYEGGRLRLEAWLDWLQGRKEYGLTDWESFSYVQWISPYIRGLQTLQSNLLDFLPSYTCEQALFAKALKKETKKFRVWWVVAGLAFVAALIFIAEAQR